MRVPRYQLLTLRYVGRQDGTRTHVLSLTCGAFAMLAGTTPAHMPSISRVNLRATDWRNGGFTPIALPHRVLPPVALHLTAPHDYRLISPGEGCSFFPILHPQDLPRHLTGLPWYYSEVCTLHCRDDRTRTCDLMVPNHAYYQLYYIPVAIMGESNPSQSSTHRSVSCRTSCIPTHRSAFSTKSLRLQPQGLCSRLASDRARQSSHDRCGP